MVSGVPSGHAAILGPHRLLLDRPVRIAHLIGKRLLLTAKSRRVPHLVDLRGPVLHSC